MSQTMRTEPAAAPSPTGRPWPSTFAALRYRNYRLWFVGQAISLMGTWMQNVAQGWLVYEMTGSEFALGAIAFAGSFPTLFLMLPAGALADRFPRRRLLLITQIVMMLCALVLAALAAAGILRVWHVGVLAFVLGIANSFDAPARQSLAVEMVEDRRDLMNAIAMNSLMFNLARVAGPAVAGVALAAVGSTLCFALNGLSFLAVLAALLMMRLPPITQKPQTEPLATQVAAGLRYIRQNGSIRTMILLAGVSSLFGLSYATLMPAYAVEVLHTGETGLGWMSTSVGVGALAGSFTVALLGRSRRKGLLMTMGSFFFPGALLLFACSRSLPLSLACLAVAGFGWVTQNATCNTLVQALVTDELRGRVMGAYTLMFFGTSPFSSLMAGSLAQVLGPATAILIGAGVTLAFSVGLLLTAPALRRLEA
jgi:MFS family permease